MATDPIRIRQVGGGMVEVDYGGGTLQNFPSLPEAEQAAQRVAEDEGREVLIED